VVVTGEEEEMRRRGCHSKSSMKQQEYIGRGRKERHK